MATPSPKTAKAEHAPEPADDANTAWDRWVTQTARTWDDLAETLRLTGIDSIDTEHRRILEASLEISNLSDLFGDNKWRLENISDEGRVIHDLYECTVDHFRNEEILIEKYGLKLLGEQKKQHENFLRMLRELIEDFENGRLNITMNLKSSVLDWLIQHINGTDFRTFCSENWIPAVAGNARNWNEIGDIIKPTGIAKIDGQHKKGAYFAIELANEIEEVIASGKERHDIVSKLDTFITYVKRHFSFEESFVTHYDIPNPEQNMEDHRYFLAEIAVWREYLAKEARFDIDGFRRFILEWWVCHVNGTDNELCSLEKWGDLIFSTKTPPDRVMEFIVKIGVDAIDEDHREITMFLLRIDDVIARFSGSGEEGGNGSYHSGVLYFEGLFEFCKKHFKREAAIMRSAGYAGYDAHMAEHRWFMNFLEKNRVNFSEGRVTASKEMKRTIFLWWINHIRMFDVKAFSNTHEEQQVT
jgi:hemerythrin-like metal-binding protein